MGQSNELLKPEPRGPVDAQRVQPGDPAPPPLAKDVAMLSSDIRLERIQADNRLRQAGQPGLMAAAKYLDDPNAPAKALIEAMNFLMRADLEIMPAAQASEVRLRLAALLNHADGKVRAAAARTLQVLGPGSQRTAFLQAIGDTESRVRWAVVRRFGDFPEEADRAQLLILLGFLQAGTDAEFDRIDKDASDSLSREEWVRADDEFKRLDRDGNGGISRSEWIDPVASPVRMDVYQVLLRLHEKLTPDQRPIVYNPYAPAGQQQDSILQWQVWIEALPKN